MRAARMLQEIKRAYYGAARTLGMSDVVGRSEWRRQRLLIIGWHGVARHDENQWDPCLYVGEDTFHRRLAILRRTGSSVLPLHEAIARLDAGTLPERAVVLTFDDGYIDFLTIAWPALKKDGFPATVYLTTKRCEHNRPLVPLLLSYLLWKHRNSQLDGHNIPGLDSRKYVLSTEQQRLAIGRAIGAAMRSMRAGEKDEVAVRVAHALGADCYQTVMSNRLLTLMNPDEVRQVSREGADIQLHTHFHQPPSDAAAFRKEIVENRRRIEAITGRAARHFCYPSGQYRSWHVPVLQEAAVVSSTTCDPGLATRRSNRHLLPRFIDTDHVSDLDFESWVVGTAGLLPHRIAASPAMPAAGGGSTTALSRAV